MINKAPTKGIETLLSVLSLRELRALNQALAVVGMGQPERPAESATVRLERLGKAVKKNSGKER